VQNNFGVDINIIPKRVFLHVDKMFSFVLESTCQLRLCATFEHVLSMLKIAQTHMLACEILCHLQHRLKSSTGISVLTYKITNLLRRYLRKSAQCDLNMTQTTTEDVCQQGADSPSCSTRIATLENLAVQEESGRLAKSCTFSANGTCTRTIMEENNGVEDGTYLPRFNLVFLTLFAV